MKKIKLDFGGIQKLKKYIKKILYINYTEYSTGNNVVSCFFGTDNAHTKAI